MGVDLVRMCGRRLGAHPCDLLGIRSQNPSQEQACAYFLNTIKAAAVEAGVVGRDTVQQGEDAATRCRVVCSAQEARR